MDARFKPDPSDGPAVLDHLSEECAEVILATRKLQRFGAAVRHVDGVRFDNLQRLTEEMRDLNEATARATVVLDRMRRQRDEPHPDDCGIWVNEDCSCSLKEPEL